MSDTADSRRSPDSGEKARGEPEDPKLHAEVTTLMEELSDLEELDVVAESPEARNQVREALDAARDVRERSRLGQIVSGVLFVADIRDVRIKNPIAGIVPRRFLGVVSVSFLTAVILLTGWGRVSWADPQLALANVVVAFVPMSIGAALGDLLPEE